MSLSKRIIRNVPLSGLAIQQSTKIGRTKVQDYKGGYGLALADLSITVHSCSPRWMGTMP